MTFSTPNLTYTQGVKSLGRFDVSGPLRVANARSAAAASVTEAAGVSAAINQNITEVIQERQNEIDSRKISASYAKDKSEFIQKHAAKTVYSSAELPEDLGVTRVEESVNEFGEKVQIPRENIPAYEVYPKILEKFLMNSIDVHAEKFGNKELGDAWADDAKTKAYRSITEAVLHSEALQRETNIKQTFQDVAEAVQRREYELAKMLLTSNTDITEDTKSKKIFEINVQEEEDHYEIILMRGKQPAVVDAITVLSDEEYDGRLTPGQRESYVLSLRRRLNSLGNTAKIARTAEEKAIKHEARKAISVMNQGGRVDPSRRMVLKSQLAGVDLELLSDFEVAEQVATITYDELIFTDPSTRARKVEEMKQLTFQYHDATKHAQIYEGVQNAAQQITTKIQSDPMGYFNTVASQELLPIDDKNLADSLKIRAKQERGIREKWHSPKMLLTKAEAADWAHKIQQGSVEDKLARLGEVHKGLMEDAYAFYTQLDVNNAGAVTIAGRAVAEGAAGLAYEILRGEETVSKNPAILSQVKADLTRQVYDTIGDLAYATPGEAAAIKEAALLLYAGRAKGVKMETVDPSILASVMTDITGGLVNMGSYVVPTPTRNGDPDAMDEWIDAMTPEVLRPFGEPINFTPERIIEGIQNQSLRLIPTAVRGHYALYNTLDYPPTFVHKRAGRGTERYIIEYHTSAVEEYRKKKEQRPELTELNKMFGNQYWSSERGTR